MKFKCAECGRSLKFSDETRVKDQIIDCHCGEIYTIKKYIHDGRRRIKITNLKRDNKHSKSAILEKLSYFNEVLDNVKVKIGIKSRREVFEYRYDNHYVLVTKGWTLQ